ncbi:RNI-like protein [Hesseltinella vesiculosa]|uniref:RNI-like protein n=1 Tax=Hesseltinella vesiculosa TaxID=101127 RepID=A0A1X2GN15_9FUNG|nr:RNI-like protein [Hesseltinella vesiculosa]
MRFLYLTNDNRLELLNTTNECTLPATSRTLDLPAELIERIFTHLPRSCLAQVSFVSRKWNAVANGLLYTHVYIRTLTHWESFIQYCVNKDCVWLERVQSLVLRPSPRLAPRSGLQSNSFKTDPDVAAQGYIRVQPVDLDNTGLERLLCDSANNIHEENYGELDTTVKTAEWLAKVSDRDMAMAVDRCCRLVYLCASGCSQIGDATMYALSASRNEQGDRSMRGLWLDLTRNITALGWKTFVNAEIRRRQTSGASQLTHLDLSFSGFIDDSCLEQALPNWSSSLTHLRLGSLYNITDATVLSISRHCSHLRLLHLVRCWRVTNESLAPLASGCPRLVYMSLAFLNQVNEQGIRHIVSGCPSLDTLDISGSGINPMFKQVILDQWLLDRRRLGLKPVRFIETPVLLL